MLEPELDDEPVPELELLDPGAPPDEPWPELEPLPASSSPNPTLSPEEDEHAANKAMTAGRTRPE